MTSHAIETLDDLKSFLKSAMQLEHATIPPYLTALYSLKPNANPAAAQVLRVIVVEEMLHLTIAANLLNAIGGKPDLTAKGFVATYPSPLPDGETDFKVSIAAFSPATLETFKKIERPAVRSATEKARAGLIKRSYPPGQTPLASHPKQRDMHFYSIGEFYQAIAEGIEHLEHKAHRQGKTIFTGDPAKQITSEYYYSGGGELHPVTNLQTAKQAIELIIEQGEGDGGGIYNNEHELAHYYRFDELSKGRYYQKGDQPGAPTGPALQVDWHAAYPIKPNLKLADIPAHSELHAAAVAFNDRYAHFLGLLTRAYNGEPKLLLEAVPVMFEFRNLILELVRNPLPNHPGFHAAPTFEIEGGGKHASTHSHAEVIA